MNRSKRLLAGLGLAAILSLGVLANPALAQEPPAEGQAGGEGTGDPVPGYIATAVLACGALFITGKSARR